MCIHDPEIENRVKDSRLNKSIWLQLLKHFRGCVSHTEVAGRAHPHFHISVAEALRHSSVQADSNIDAVKAATAPTTVSVAQSHITIHLVVTCRTLAISTTTHSDLIFIKVSTVGVVAVGLAVFVAVLVVAVASRTVSNSANEHRGCMWSVLSR
jgi:hypothetical protein